MENFIEYHVGEKFPHDQYLNRGEISIAKLNNSFFDVVCVFPDIKKQERNDWRKGKLKVHLFIKESVPYVCFDFGYWSVDVNINVHKLNDEDLDVWLNSESNVINLYLIEARTGNLEGMRMISIPIEFSEKIRDVCETQCCIDEKMVKTSLEKTLSSITTRQMMKESTLRYVVK